MKQKTYLRWGVTITAAACAILVFYDTFFQDGVLFIFIEKLFGILKPVLYGLAMAYLLTPIVDFFDRLLRDRLGAKRAGLMRCLSILVTWLLALGLVYLLFSILIPELVASVSLLFSNLESYYRTIYTWVTQLVEDNPYISERVLTLVRDYYNELVDWVKNTVIPGAQVAIVAVTGGVLSVLVFAKDLLVGIVVSVYILAARRPSASTRASCSTRSSPRRTMSARCAPPARPTASSPALCAASCSTRSSSAFCASSSARF